MSLPRFRASSEGKRFTKFAEGPGMVPSGSARVELVQRATTFALIAALKAQDNPTKLNLAGMRWPNPPPKRDIRDLHQFSFFSYEKWSKISTPAPLRRPPRPPRCTLAKFQKPGCFRAYHPIYQVSSSHLLLSFRSSVPPRHSVKLVCLRSLTCV